MKLFSTGDAARILNLPGSRIRSWVHRGFLSPGRGPGRRFRFTFQDLLLLKTTKELQSQVPARTLVRMLASLKRQLPEARHLSRLKIVADGRRIVVSDGGSRWQPDSGQLLLNFDVQSVAKKLSLARPGPGGVRRTLDADDWFRLGVELEATSAAEARRAYRRALDIDPEMAEAHLNLGKLYHDSGEWRKAETHYGAAARCAPDDPVPRFNLGVLFEDMRRPNDAAAAYREAIRLDPRFADAHYNLGLLLESLGKKADAIAHLRSARKLYRGKPRQE
ncbi:MAG TPA: tetratricopeptide repeat protein [candidate division Zixibacteria bacterium]|nr:tetratricopeptide repeat protein [candidate division Zixibacteria bacterium]